MTVWRLRIRVRKERALPLLYIILMRLLLIKTVWKNTSLKYDVINFKFYQKIKF